MLPAQSLGWLLGHHAQCPSPSPEPAPIPSSFPNPSLTCRDIQRPKLTCHSTGTPGIRGAPWSSARGSPAGLPAVPQDSLNTRSLGRVCRLLASVSPQGRHPAPAVCDWGTARDVWKTGGSQQPLGQAGLVEPAWPGVRSQEGAGWRMQTELTSKASGREEQGRGARACVLSWRRDRVHCLQKASEAGGQIQTAGFGSRQTSAWKSRISLFFASSCPLP